jgi:HSP20 family protein
MAEVTVTKAKKPEILPIAEFPFFRGNIFEVNPFALMRKFTEEMNHYFEGAKTGEKGFAWAPAIEVKEEAGKLLMNVELPGLKKEEVKVSVADDVLTVEGERKQEKEEKREGYFHSERHYGKFMRSIRLPEGANAGQITANITDGMLTVAVPVAAKAQVKRDIPVAAAEAKAKTA